MIIKAPQAADISALRGLWKDTFCDTDAFLDAFFSTAFSSERALCAVIDGTMAGMLYWFDCSCEENKIAYLYAVATHKDYRGRGVCSALMEKAHQCLKEQGYVGVLLVPADAHLFDFYARMGYRTSVYHRILCCAAGNEGIALRSISATEYAALRRQFLPPQSVLQERENLAFLQTVVQFWEADGCLLATRSEGDTLLAPELLGDVKQAPRIVRALGFAKGEFRTFGGDTPFAMYRSVAEPLTLAPAYFAFAFD